MKTLEIPVLIVGAGPVGMTAALLLERLGVPHRVIDRRAGPHRAPQAHVVNPRSLEIFRALDLDMEKLRDLATPREEGGWVRFVTRLVGDELGVLPYERQDDDVLALTPTPILNLPQHLLEPVLLETLRARNGDGVHWGHQWESLRQDDSGVTARVRMLDSGEEYEVRSRHLLAADGAGSRVRRDLGIEMEGPASLRSFVMVHFAADLRPLVAHRPAALYWIMDPSCAGTFIAHRLDRSWVFMHPFDPEAETADDYDSARCAAIVRAAIGRDDVALDVRDVSVWHMSSQIAASYGSGRVFLIGDAAHRFPPAGGMGMNSGIQDAHNLVWKLVASERGWAGRALLDTYEAERRPVAKRNADQSLANALEMLKLHEVVAAADPAALFRDARRRAELEAAVAAQQDHFDMLGLQLGFRYDSSAIVSDGTAPPAPANPVREYVPTTCPGGRLPHAWVRREGRRVSLLDLAPYDRFTVIAGEAGGAWRSAAAGAAAPLAVIVAGEDFDDAEGRWAEVSGLSAGGAVLVRPDQHVAWRAREAVGDPGVALRDALARASARALA